MKAISCFNCNNICLITLVHSNILRIQKAAILGIVILSVFIFFNTKSFAQAIGLNNTNPDPSSILDLSSPDKGVLVPRMTQAERNAISNPATALLIYQSDNTPGFYYNAGTPASPVWVPLLSTNVSTAVGTGGWSLTGTAGTTAGTNYLGTTDGTDLVFKTNATERLRIYDGNGLSIPALTTATSTALDIGALSGSTANTGINIGNISGTGTASGLTTGTISGTGTVAYQLNLGSISGANATSHTGISMGNISGSTANAYGINLGTLTGGTTGNYQIKTGSLTATGTTSSQLDLGSITSTGSTNSYGVNIGGISGSGTNTYGINVSSLTSTGTGSTGIYVSGLSGASTTNTGIQIGTVSGGTTNNFGLKISGTAAGTGNYSVYADAAAQNYFAGKVGINTTSPNVQMDINGAAAFRPSTVALTADNQSVDVSNTSFLLVTSNNATSTNRTIALGNGSQAGQILWIMSNDNDAARAFELVSGVGSYTAYGTQTFNNMYDVVVCLWNGSVWVLMEASTGY